MLNPRFSFLWIYTKDYEKARKEPKWKSRGYKVETIQEACQRMAKFLEGRDRDEVEIDYEAFAEHVPYNAREHKKTYPNLNSFDNPLQQYLH